MSKGLKRHCLECGRLTRGKTRCTGCGLKKAVKYGPGHRKLREIALRANEGVLRAICPLCNLPLGHDPSLLELDHAQPIVDGGLDGPKRLTHSKCNSRAGGIRGTTYKPKGKRGS